MGKPAAPRKVGEKEALAATRELAPGLSVAEGIRAALKALARP